jgi:hypothetical protein
MSNTQTPPMPDFSGLTFEKVWAMFQETDKKFQETDRKFQEAREQAKEADRKLQEKIDRILGSQGELSNRFGDLIEHLIFPGVIPRFNELGFQFTETARNIQIKDPKTGKVLTELDYVLENGSSVVVVEVKSDPSLRDVKKFIHQLQIFREHRNHSQKNPERAIYGAIAGAVFPEDVRQASIEAGFYVIVQSGDTVQIEVPNGFKPQVF